MTSYSRAGRGEKPVFLLTPLLLSTHGREHALNLVVVGKEWNASMNDSGLQTSKQVSSPFVLAGGETGKASN